MVISGRGKKSPAIWAGLNLNDFARTGSWLWITGFSHAITHTALVKLNEVRNHV